MGATKRVEERIQSAMKRMFPVLEQQRTRDVSEADTVTLVKDLLSEVFGYDKYADLTGEMAIRGTFCDLAIKEDDKVVVIIETKAIGITLNDRHLKQVVDYAANHGVEWVILTNAVTWRLYQVLFEKPIDKRLIIEADLTAVDCRKEDAIDALWVFCKEGFKKGAHIEIRDRHDATSRFLLAALILENDAVLGTIRRELRRIVEVNVGEEEIAKVLRDEVVKRDALEGPAAETAQGRVRRGQNKLIREARPKGAIPESVDVQASMPIAPIEAKEV